MTAGTAPHALAFVDSDHADTPYDAWAAGAGARLTLLVSAEKYPQYAHLPEARPITGYHEGGELELAALESAGGQRPSAVLARGEGTCCARPGCANCSTCPASTGTAPRRSATRC